MEYWKRKNQKDGVVIIEWADLIKDYLPEMSKQWRARTTKQLTEEIETQLIKAIQEFKAEFKQKGVISWRQ